MGRERFPVVPPNLGCSLNKKPRRDGDGEKGQPHLMEYVGFVTGYTLCPDNGGSSGAGYSIILSPCSSENHSALGYAWHFHQLAILWASFLCLLFLFTAFENYFSIDGQFIAFNLRIVKAFQKR
jgi:hypothetical protein